MSGGGGISDGVKGGNSSATGTLEMPFVRLRVSASDGGLANYKDAYYGMQTTRTTTSTVSDPSVKDFHKMLYYNYTAGGGDAGWKSTTGVQNFAYVFTLDDVELKNDGGPTGYYYALLDRVLAVVRILLIQVRLIFFPRVLTASLLLFGADSTDLILRSPILSTTLEWVLLQHRKLIIFITRGSVEWTPWPDPDFINMNLLVAPGLTQNKLTEHAIAICEDRADAMTIIDLPDVYIPNHEAYKATRSDRVGTNPCFCRNSV